MARRGITRREFLQAAAAAAAAAAVLPVARLASPAAAGDAPSGSYYEYFIVTDPERIQFYSSLGLIIEVDGKKCVANPLLPDRCISYTKPYWEDKFPLRPPGAGSDFHAKCVRCGLCYFACTYQGYHAIRLVGAEGGFANVGTPVVDNMIKYPCTLCMECTKVCPTGALAEIPKEDVKMGVALIDPDLCWAWNSGDCKSCAKACPFGAEVFKFTFTEWGVHTQVIPEKCKGCGLCVQACPITGSAIHVLPRDEYEKRTRSFKNTGMSYEEYLKLILETEYKDPTKATYRSMVNTDYIQNKRGIVKEKIKV